MKKIVSDLRPRTKFIKDTVNDIQFVYAVITADKKQGERGEEERRDYYERDYTRAEFKETVEFEEKYDYNDEEDDF